MAVKGTWSKIDYRGFYDVPRIFVVADRAQSYLFSCPFDDELDEYPETYKVYLLPAAANRDGNWEELHHQAVSYLGEVPVKDVRFDATRRGAIDMAVLEELECAARSKQS